MKKKIIYTLLIFLPLFVMSQSNAQKTFAKFIVLDASTNGVDETEYLLDQGAYTVFYTTEDNFLYMANVWPKDGTQSYGRLYASEHKKLNETYDSYEADIFYFKWRYINDYDSKRGTATVKFVKIYKPQGVSFNITIIPENLDVIVFKGYMDGTLDLSNYSN